MVRRLFADARGRGRCIETTPGKQLRGLKDKVVLYYSLGGIIIMVESWSV